MLAAVALKNTTTKHASNEIHDDEDRNERGIYGGGGAKRVQEGTISVDLRTRALIPSPSLSPVLYSLTMARTCVSRRVKTCHARFATRKQASVARK